MLCQEPGCSNLGESKGSGIRHTRCHRHRGRNVTRALRRKPYLMFRGSVCERCDFQAEDPCQLDVDHKDGNHANNNPDNLATLCANCHRLKTRLERIA